MQARDIFRSPTVNLNQYQSIDVSRLLHAADAQGEWRWTFTGSGGAEWTTIQTGSFRTAAVKAVKAYCQAYGTKFARLILVSKDPL
jgi:hypothetical protein